MDCIRSLFSEVEDSKFNKSGNVISTQGLEEAQTTKELLVSSDKASHESPVPDSTPVQCDGNVSSDLPVYDFLPFSTLCPSYQIPQLELS